MSNEKIYFNEKEAVVIGLGLARLVDDLNETQSGKLADMPWTPEARKAQRDMLVSAKSAAAKLEKFTGIECKLPGYNPDDEQQFFTKES
jgi:hypothetical protein